ncbi:hypothetical protein SAY87_012048 [Trapa incisa]|uniref:Chromatin assembly factor 1 subunit Cac1-like C-terminal domain-containing protein n=1 Tax=Trapa incisa TaxID=236973 RepID=A0AAN7GGV5_9MYRT|nr:hypothetical protein SAY87_012048 [Trapa incisa]
MLPPTNLSAVSESDLSTIVSTIIISCPQSINKLVDSLQQKFRAISRSQLKNKDREISDYVDNRWQVKKEVLDKLGLPVSPDRRVRRTKTIATFFSKRCLPPDDKNLSAHGNQSQQNSDSSS